MVTVCNPISRFEGLTVEIIGGYELRTIHNSPSVGLIRKWCYMCSHPESEEKRYYPAHHVLVAAEEPREPSGFALWLRQIEGRADAVPQ